MRFSTKTRYGLRAMIDLAIHYKDKPVLVREIAERQKISGKYLEQIMLSLKKAGLVESIAGARGGYMLTKKPSEIKALHIVEVLEGALSPVPCADHGEICEEENTCPARELWIKVKKSVKDALNSVSLKDLSENKPKKKGVFYQI
ncbi:MAG: Rrf2 family transcriptional regulator [Candidatus Omnitrophica bacterium]|nr:Rrf2 family transcriptional regulator [Candidatus Omnitrophota bacterium]